MFEVHTPGYKALMKGQTHAPSIVMGILPPDLGQPTPCDVLSRMENGPIPIQDLALVNNSTIADARFELRGAAVNTAGRPLAFTMWIEPCKGFEDLHLQWHRPGRLPRVGRTRSTRRHRPRRLPDT